MYYILMNKYYKKNIILPVNGKLLFWEAPKEMSLS